MTESLIHAAARRSLLATTMALVLLTGCATRTPFEKPAAALPDHWVHGAAAAMAAQSVLAVQLPPAFAHDEQLQALLAVIADSSRELAATALKVRKAQLQAGLAGNARWPQPTAGANAQTSRPLGDGGQTIKSYGANLGLAYELDLWRRLETEHDMARWEAQATAEDRRNVHLSLLATAGSLYYQLGSLNQRVRLTEANLDNARRTLGLVEAQYRFGAASALELAEARQSLRTQQASFEQLIQQRVETRNALAVLSDGRDLSAYEPQSLPEQGIATLPAGLPASLLSRRPDLQAAEIRLRRGLAAVDTARTSFYPAITLNTTAGGTSSELHNVLSNPVGTLAASIALPFINIGKARRTTAIAQADFDQAALEFQRSLLTAFAEVDNALSAGVRLSEQQSYLNAALADAVTAERLYEARYREGAVALRDWISAQDRRRQAEMAAVENRYGRYGNAITSLKSLGIPLSSANNVVDTAAVE